MKLLTVVSLFILVVVVSTKPAPERQKRFVQFLSKKLAEARNTLTNVAEDVGDFVQDSVHDVGNGANKVGDFFEGSVRDVGKVANKVGDVVEDVGETANRVVVGVGSISRAVYREIYTAAKTQFEAIEDLQNIGFDDAVQHLIGLIDSDSTRCVCMFYCKKAGVEILNKFAGFAAGQACSPLCSSALAKLEDFAEAAVKGELDLPDLKL